MIRAINNRDKSHTRQYFVQNETEIRYKVVVYNKIWNRSPAPNITLHGDPCSIVYGFMIKSLVFFIKNSNLSIRLNLRNPHVDLYTSFYFDV